MAADAETSPPRPPRTGFWARAFAASGLTAGWFLVVFPAAFLALASVAGWLGPEIAVVAEDHVRIRELNIRLSLIIALLGFVLFNSLGLWWLKPRRVWGLLGTVVVVTLVISVWAFRARSSSWAQPSYELGRLFCFWMQVTLATTVTIVAAAWICTRAAWALARRWGFAAGVVGASTLLGAPLPATVGLLAVVAMSIEDDLESDDVFESDADDVSGSVRDLLEFLAEDGRETARAKRLVSGAGLRRRYAFLEVPSAHAGTRELPSFDRCLLALNTRKKGESDSKIDQATRHLRKGNLMTFEEARDLAADKALAACERVGRRAELGEEEARAYYWTAVKRARIDRLRGRGSPWWDRPEDLLDLPAPPGMEEAAPCLGRARARLSHAQRQLLMLCVEFPVREIETRTGLSKSSAQRQCQEVTNRFRDMILNDCA